jgi:hypothetical protein
MLTYADICWLLYATGTSLTLPIVEDDEVAPLGDEDGEGEGGAAGVLDKADVC